MTRDLFLKKINILEGQNLYSQKSHNIFFGNLREYISPNDIIKQNPKHSGVLLLFFERDEKIKLLLEERNIYEGIHSGQICFVGGKKEKNDVDIKFTAKREAQEETNINKNNIDIIKDLSPVYIPPSNFLVYPFVAFYKIKNPVFINKNNEVKKFIEVNIMDIINTDLEKVEIETNYFGKKQTLAFIFNGKIVWGATAMILQEFKDLFLEVLK